MAHYQIEKELATIEDSGGKRVILNLISWNGDKPRYDLRVWRMSYPEGWLPAQGLVFDDDAAQILVDALKKWLSMKAESSSRA